MRVSLEVSQIVDEMRNIIELVEDGDMDYYDGFEELRNLVGKINDDE